MRIYSQPLNWNVAPIVEGHCKINARFRPRFGWIDYLRESRIQYLLGNPSRLGLFKIFFKMLSHDLSTHPIATLRYFFMTLIIEISDDQISLLKTIAFQSQKSLWISRTAIMGGVDSNEIDETLEYDFYRCSKFTEMRIWKSQLSPKKFNALNILNNGNWKVINLKESQPKFNENLEFTELKNVAIHHGHCVTQNGFFFPLDTTSLSPNFSWPSAFPKRFKDRVVLLQTQKREVLTTAIFIGYSKSWYHFIVEYLPRYLEIPLKFRAFPVILPSGVLPQIRQMLGSFGFPNLVETKLFTEIAVSRLLTVTDFRNINSHHPRDRSSDILRLKQKFTDLPSSNVELNQTISRNIILVRPKHLFRQIENIDELVKDMVKIGYKAVYLERLSFLEQVALMQQCKFLIAESGAALTSLLFSSSTITVLELEQFSTKSDNFWESYCQILSHKHSKLMSIGKLTKTLRRRYFINREEVIRATRVLEN